MSGGAEEGGGMVNITSMHKLKNWLWMDRRRVELIWGGVWRLCNVVGCCWRREEMHILSLLWWNDPMVVGWSNHCGEMIQWLWGDPIIMGKWSNGCGVMQSLWGNDPMVVGWSNHYGEMIQWLWGDPVIVGKWSNGGVEFSARQE